MVPALLRRDFFLGTVIATGTGTGSGSGTGTGTGTGGSGGVRESIMSGWVSE